MTTTTSTNYRIEPIHIDDLSATDLHRAAQESLAHPVGMEFSIARVWIGEKAEPAFALYFDDCYRGAIAWGADAVWTDCSSMQDLIERYLSDDMIS